MKNASVLTLIPARNPLIFMDYRRTLKQNKICFPLLRSYWNFSLSACFNYVCVCGAWWTIESWQPVGWDPTITSQINATQNALMGHDKKFGCCLGCNYPAGCCREWPPLLWYLLNPDLTSGLISKSLSALPIPRPSTVDSEPP